MAALAPRLLPLALLLLSTAPLAFSAGGGSGVLVDAGDFTYIDDEPMTNAEAAQASLDLIMAEMAAAAAVEAEVVEAEPPPGGWEVWDSEDDDDEVITNKVNSTDGAPPPPPQPVVPAPLDALFDFALGAAVHQLVAQGKSQEPVPDFKKQFSMRLGPIKVHGHLDASGGTAGDLSSLFRDGSATLRRESNGVLVLEAAAGLRHLQLRYNHYSARAGPIRVSGTLEAEASPATLRAALTLEPPCVARLSWLRVQHVGPLRVRASGLGALRRLLPLLQRWFDKKLRGDVEKMVVQRLTTIVNTELQRFSCAADAL